MRCALPCGLLNLFVVLIFARLGVCYNILVIFGHPGKSHYDVFKPLFQELGERGHNITIISHVKTKGDIKNGRDVLISDNPLTDFLDLEYFPGNRMQKYLEAHLIAFFAHQSCRPSLESDNLQRFLKEDNHFDVILVEFFNSNCLYGLINKYQAPFIGLSSCSMMAWHPQWFGSPENPSYIPSIYMAYPPPMTFFQRVENTLVHLAHKVVYKFFMERPGTQLSINYTGFEPVNPYNASLFLLNTHHTLHGARPFTPSIVEVGGIHVANRTPKKLPKDIEAWINSSPSGLIYFSLGSLIKGHTFPKDKLRIFVKVLSELPQKVLWKWESDIMEYKANNIMVTKWAPQFDILCHPNTKLFISHGGLLGTTEAVHCGVPVLVMPQFGDQPLNAAALEKNDAGVILKLREATEEGLREALQKALSLDTSAKELSQRFRDRLSNPINTSVYSVEHVAKYKGAKHMRSAGIDMPFYQYHLLDVIAFLLLVVLLSVYINIKILMFMFRCCFKSKQKVKTS